MAIRAQVMSEEVRCYQCGALGQADDLVDHVVPLSQRGTDDRHNLRRICRRCHAMKTGRESARSREGRGR
jgi:5-methylcytosine-specific restriction enzyme A